MKLSEDQKRQVCNAYGFPKACPNPHCESKEFIVCDYLYQMLPVQCDSDDYRCTPLRFAVGRCPVCGLSLFFSPPDPWRE